MSQRLNRPNGRKNPKKNLINQSPNDNGSVFQSVGNSGSVFGSSAFGQSNPQSSVFGNPSTSVFPSNDASFTFTPSSVFNSPAPSGGSVFGQSPGFTPITSKPQRAQQKPFEKKGLRNERPPRQLNPTAMQQERKPRQQTMGMQTERPPRQQIMGMQTERPPRQQTMGMQQERPPRQQAMAMQQERPPRQQTMGMQQERALRQQAMGMQQERTPRQAMGMQQERAPRQQQSDSQYQKTLKGMQESNKKVFVRPVPAELNKVSALRQFFSQVGQVVNVECVPDKNHAIIEFAQKSEAISAISTIKTLANKPVQVRWAKLDIKKVSAIAEGQPSTPMMSTAKPQQQRQQRQQPIVEEVEEEEPITEEQYNEEEAMPQEEEEYLGEDNGQYNEEEQYNEQEEQYNEEEQEEYYEDDNGMEVASPVIPTSRAVVPKPVAKPEPKKPTPPVPSQPVPKPKPVRNIPDSLPEEPIPKPAPKPEPKKPAPKPTRNIPETSLAEEEEVQVEEEEEEEISKEEPQMLAVPKGGPFFKPKKETSLTDRQNRFAASTPKPVYEPPPPSIEPVISQSSDGPPAIIVGTCADMCPLEERLIREKWGDLDVFEMEPSTITDPSPRVKHEWAVKKFVRPNAENDDKTKRPEVNRPPKVLQITWDYLLDNILERNDVPFYVVHNFLWDRTRAIRQDFGRQRILDVQKVAIFEQITRYHILVHHKLIEEDGSNFDAFQNMEQLNKALISLQEDYNDLYIRYGIECPNEAEFQSYYILNHIQSEIYESLDKITTDNVRNSPRIQRVLRIHNMLIENNYYGYFQELKKIDYFSAILQYIGTVTKVRANALRILNATYNKKEQIPLVDLLCFEDAEEAEMMCLHHGLTFNNGSLSCRDSSYVAPEKKYKAIRKSLKVIEPKIAGKRLADIIRYGTEDVAVSRTVPKPKTIPPKIVAPKPAASPKVISPKVAPPAKPPSPKVELVRVPSKPRIEIPAKPPTPTPEIVPKPLTPKIPVVTAPPPEVLPPIVFNKPPSVLSFMPVPEMLPQQPPTAIFVPPPPTPIFIPEITITVPTPVKPPSPVLPPVPKGPTKEELKQKKRQEENERVLMLRKKLYFNIWLKNVQEIKEEKERIRLEEEEKKKKLEMYMAAIGTDVKQPSLNISMKDKLKKLMGNTKKMVSPWTYIQNHSSNISKLKQLYEKYQLRKQEFWAPMDVTDYVYDILYSINKESKQSFLYWKLAVSCDVPFTQDPPKPEHEQQIWTLAKLSQTATIDSSTPNTQILSLYTAEKHPNMPPLKLCIKNIYQEQQINSELLQHELVGCNSILFLVNSLHFEQRLFKVLEAIEEETDCNLCVLITNDTNPNEVQKALTPDLLRKIKYFCVGVLDQNEKNTSLAKCLKWMSSHTRPIPKLEKYGLRELVEMRVGYTTERLSYLQPQDYVSIWNSTLIQLEKEITDSKLLKLGWPIPEFPAIPLDWNSEDTMNSLTFHIRKLKLPPFPVSKITYETILFSIRDYLPKFSKKNVRSLSSQLVKIASEHFSTFSKQEIFPWNKVFEILFQYRFSEIDVNQQVFVFPNGRRLYDSIKFHDYQPIKISKEEEEEEEADYMEEEEEEEEIPDTEITVSRKRRNEEEAEKSTKKMLLEAPTFYESSAVEKTLFEDLEKEREQTQRLWEKLQRSVDHEQNSFNYSAVEATMQKLTSAHVEKRYTVPKTAKVEDLLTNLDELKKQEQKFLEYLKKCL